MLEFEIFDLVMLIAVLILTAILTFLDIFTNDWSIGIEKMESLEKIMGASSDIMVSLLIIVGCVLVLAFLVMFIRWLSKDEEGIMILPFDVAAGDDKYSGKAISQLLTAELLSISRIHDPEVKYEGITPIESERLSLPVIAPSSENLTYTVTQMGPVGLGMTSIHIGPLMAILKRLWPGGDNGQVISGSLQRYGSVISMIACLEHKEISAWEASCDIEDRGRKGDDKIPGIAKDLAFMIIHDLQHEEISAKTWQGFKHFTDALDAYHQYSLTGSKDYLEMARAECLKAADSEKSYEKLIELLYNVGMAYADLRELYKGEELLLKAISINPKDYVLFGLGYLYVIQDQNQTALEYFDNALEYLEKNRGIDLDKAEINRKKSIIWSYKGLALNNLKRLDEALEACEKAIELEPKNAGAWSSKGVALDNLGKSDDSIQVYEKAAELEQKSAALFIALARLYRKHGREADSIEACKSARDLIDTESEYNRACFEAVCGSPDAALDLLRTALEKREQTADWARQDPDLESIRDDPRFAALLDEFSPGAEKGP